MASAHADMIDHGELVHDYARDSVLAELVESMAEENKTYAVIDGYPIYRDGIKVVKVDMAESDGAAPGKKPLADIVLATDGYPFLCATLEKSERKLRRQLDTDPYNIGEFKATKGLLRGNVSFDDRATSASRPTLPNAISSRSASMAPPITDGKYSQTGCRCKRGCKTRSQRY